MASEEANIVVADIPHHTIMRVLSMGAGVYGDGDYVEMADSEALNELSGLLSQPWQSLILSILFFLPTKISIHRQKPISP
jgi:hypothetical protein